MSRSTDRAGTGARRFGLLLVLAGWAFGAGAGVDPASLEFARVASRRFMLDNELTLCEYAPRTAVAAGVQHPALTNGLTVVGGYWPAAHYRIRVEGLPAEIAFAKRDGEVVLRFPVAGKNLPKPPFDFSVLMTCGHRPAVFATKEGKTSLLDIPEFPRDLNPRLRANLQAWKFCFGGQVSAARASLSAGIGQADVRFVTTGRDNALYMEGNRVFFTFSARAYGAYQAVASFDPSLFDVRLEGVILFDYGDGELRNDLASHLFYDDVEGFWKGYASNFSTGTDALGQRREGGLNAVWSERNPLHGLSVMRAKDLALTGMNEDPCATWDEAAKRWSLLVSEFTPGGIRASLLQSRTWDGTFVNVAGPVERDSTGTTITRIGGVRYCLSGSADRACYVYSYPDLKMRGKLKFDFPPWDAATCPNGRVWPCLAELPDGYPFRYILLTMDRANFPGMPRPNWTYGGLCFYGAN
ncbi:MAG: hypothetical protein ACI4RA_02065 [Kiritimatiellia bacterium]